MKKYIIYITFILATIACGQSAYLPVSMLELICNPGKYSGKQVQIVGHLYVSSDGGYYLYFSRESIECMRFREALALDSKSLTALMNEFRLRRNSGKVVFIEGVFISRNQDGWPVDFGYIKDVTMIKERQEINVR